MKMYIQNLAILLISSLTSCVLPKKAVNKDKLPTCYKTGSHISYPESKYITAYTFDKDEKRVMLLARKEISAKISSTIKAKSTSVKEAFRKNKNLISYKAKFLHTAEVETSFAHNELIEIVDTYYDGSKYYAFAVIDRKRYADVLESEMKIANDKFKSKYKTALKFLDELNIKKFKEVKKDLVKDAFTYQNILVNYSTTINQPEIFEKHSLIKSISNIDTIYKEKLNQSWYIYSIYNKFNESDFKALKKAELKEAKSKGPEALKEYKSTRRSWILRDNDENRDNFVENKELTKFVYETIRDDKFKTFELSEYYNPKKNIKVSDLDNIIDILKGKKDKIVLSSKLLYKCSYDSHFYYCRTGADVKAYNLNNKEQLFYFSVEGQTSRLTKSSDIDLREALKKSIKKLSPIIKEKVLNYMKDYKDIE